MEGREPELGQEEEGEDQEDPPILILIVPVVHRVRDRLLEETNTSRAEEDARQEEDGPQRTPTGQD